MSTFETYSPLRDGQAGIYEIGNGVAQDMAAAFDYELPPSADVDNLGGLIGAVGPAKELQTNIAGVQATLGTTEDAVSIARGWSERSGLLIPVERSFATAEKAEGKIDLAVITGGVRNWMSRRSERLAALHEARNVSGVLLAAGNRTMKPAEGPDVEEGMTEGDYFYDVIAPKLGRLGLTVEVLKIDSAIGDEVMARATQRVGALVDLDKDRLALVSNAGAWVQNGGQLLRAVKGLNPVFDADGHQFEVVSDAFALGTGTEPTATHQNPFTAVGQIARNLQEFTRHTM